MRIIVLVLRAGSEALKLGNFQRKTGKRFWTWSGFVWRWEWIRVPALVNLTHEKRSAHARLPCFRRIFAIEIICDNKTN